MKFTRLAVLLVLPALLSSCFLAPGAFTAALDLKRNGDFTFAYKGEIVFQSPDEFSKISASPDKPWADTMAICPKDGEPRYDEYEMAEDIDGEDSPNRACTAAEIAPLRGQWQDAKKAKAEKDAKEAAQFAAMFGFNPNDEVANTKLAATMMRYDGWRSVVYRGKGVFAVDYQAQGRIGHDFVFPVMPKGDLFIPFVTVRGQDAGSVRVAAPALIGGGLRAIGAQMKMLGMSEGKDMPQSSRTRGTLTVTAEGEVLTNNTADGPTTVAGGRRLVWEIDPQTEKAPEALIKLR